MTFSQDDDAMAEPSEEELASDPDPVAPETYGHAEVRVDVDEQTFRRLREEYLKATLEGYDDSFATFVHNRCRTSYVVTVDGEPIDGEPGDSEGDS
jgi:hypothetical protein